MPDRSSDHARARDRAPTPRARISTQALDVLFKLEAEHLAHLLPSRFGLVLAPIRRHLPTEGRLSP